MDRAQTCPDGSQSTTGRLFYDGGQTRVAVKKACNRFLSGHRLLTGLDVANSRWSVPNARRLEIPKVVDIPGMARPNRTAADRKTSVSRQQSSFSAHKIECARPLIPEWQTYAFLVAEFRCKIIPSFTAGIACDRRHQVAA